MLAADAAAACTEFCLVSLGDEIHVEIGFALVSVGVNCLRDLRVVVGIIVELITCAGVKLAKEPDLERPDRVAHWG